MIVKAEKDTEVNLCTCKQSKNLPYCNDSHLSI
jgi:CDGSH-type Zn-finger protein